jgi:hypothetical protein
MLSSKFVFGESLILFLGGLLSIFIVAISCGPWAGALIGVVFLLIFTGGAIPLDYSYDPPITLYRSGYPEWLLFAVIGFMAGLLAQNGFFKTWWSSLTAGYLVSVTDALLFQILDRLFGISYVAGQRLLATDILSYFLRALFSIFINLHLGFLLIVIAFAAFIIVNLPFFSQTVFVQGLPQAGKTFSFTLDSSEPGTSLQMTKVNKSSNKVIGFAIFFFIFILISILAYIGYLLMLGLAIGAFGK